MDQKNRNRIEKNQERCILAVSNDYSSNYLKLLQSSGSVSMELNDYVLMFTKLIAFRGSKWLKYKFCKINILSFSKYNPQEKKIWWEIGIVSRLFPIRFRIALKCSSFTVMV